MIILAEPFASEPLIEWIEQSRHPVLDNAMARKLVEQGHSFNLVSDKDAEARLAADERLYTNSENALEWVIAHGTEEMKHTIELFKDKAAMRRLLAPLNPELFFRTCPADQLKAIEFEELPLPFVLKPSVGFCSMGVYPIRSREDWNAALADIDRNTAVWQSRYPSSVVGAGEFIMEGFLTGQEYAIDMYFDEDGRAHVLNILRHDFASPEDTSDRLYATSADIVAEVHDLFEKFLNDANELIGARTFPVHVEVRVDNGNVQPIEFNPLRFAGLGGTDVSMFAYGFRTYEAYLENKPVSFVPCEGKTSDKYIMSLLNPAPDAPLDAPLDYDALMARFTYPIEIHEFDVNQVGSYGFMFLKSTVETENELQFLLNTDLKEFLKR